MTYQEINNLYEKCKRDGEKPSYVSIPDYGETNLGCLRKLGIKTPAIEEILKLGDNLPDSVVVAMTPKYISFLQDEDGNLLQSS